MSRSLPPEFGETPTRIVFEGVEPGSAAAQLLYRQLQGQISRFQFKARQARTISEQPGAHMHQALPGGGMLRYTYNDGIETVYVRAEPARPVVVQPQPAPPRPDRHDPVLAIDLLFYAQGYEAAEIWTYTETTTYYPPTPDEFEPDANIFFYASEVTGNVMREGPIPAAEWQDHFVKSAAQRGHVQNISGPTTLTLVPGKSFPLALNVKDLASWLAYASGPDVPGAIIKDVIQITYGDPAWNYGWGDGIQTVVYTIGAVQRGRGRIPGKPGYSVVSREYEAYAYDYFDVLGVGGVVGDPDTKTSEPYDAVSVGQPDNDDARLIPASELQPGPRVERMLAISDPNQTYGFVGAGFLARPRDTQRPGETPTKTVIDVYIASSNNVQSNSRESATPTSALGRDDPGMNYEPHQMASCLIQAREFVDGTPIAVEVRTRTERRKSLREGRPGGGSGIEMSDREVTWHFAAGPNWTDNGTAPAEPDRNDASGAPMMGKLLGWMYYHGEQAVTEPQPRRFVNAPEWAGGAREMVRACRIEWSPSAHPGVHGTAVLSGGFQPSP